MARKSRKKVGDPVQAYIGLDREFWKIYAEKDAIAQKLSAGDYIRIFRKEKGWNQAKLAKEAGVNVETISRVENGGNTQTETLNAIIKALRIPLIDTRPVKKATSPEVALAREKNEDLVTAPVLTAPAVTAEEMELLELWRALPEEFRPDAVASVRSLVAATRSDAARARTPPLPAVTQGSGSTSDQGKKRA